MTFDPLLINATSSDLYCTGGHIELEEYCYPEILIAYDDDDINDLDNLEATDDYADPYLSLLDCSISSKFIRYMCSKENEYFSESFCHKYFKKSRFSNFPEELVNLNRVDAWNIDWAYGLMYQAFVAKECDLELPSLKKRNRKIPIIREKMKRPYKSKAYYDKDPIYDELIADCKLTETESYKRKSPRDQVLLHIFILDLLMHPYYRFCIEWSNKKDFTFEIKNSRAIAHIWMTIKGNDTCNYENFARGIRFKRRNSNMFTSTNKHNRCVYQLTKTAIHDYKVKRSKNELAKQLLDEALL